MSSSERGNFHRVLVSVFTRECVVWFYIPVLPDFLQCFIHSEFHDTLIRLHNWDFFFVLNKSGRGGCGVGKGKQKLGITSTFFPLLTGNGEGNRYYLEGVKLLRC